MTDTSFQQIQLFYATHELEYYEKLAAQPPAPRGTDKLANLFNGCAEQMAREAVKHYRTRVDELRRELGLPPREHPTPPPEPTMTTDKDERKGIPLYRGVLKYFPDALCEVAKCSLAGNLQHHSDKPLHWDKSKSSDEGDALMRHLIEAGTIDDDGIRHSAKVAWRALALLQRELDAERGAPQPDSL